MPHEFFNRIGPKQTWGRKVLMSALGQKQTFDETPGCTLFLSWS